MDQADRRIAQRMDEKNQSYLKFGYITFNIQFQIQVEKIPEEKSVAIAEIVSIDPDQYNPQEHERISRAYAQCKEEKEKIEDKKDAHIKNMECMDLETEEIIHEIKKKKADNIKDQKDIDELQIKIDKLDNYANLRNAFMDTCNCTKE